MNKRIGAGFIIGIMGVISITLGISYSFFHHVQNQESSKKITFLYTEVLGVGNGISLVDSFPMPDEIGKNQIREGKFFDFKILSDSTKNYSIPYEITIRKQKTSTLSDNLVKIYLTELKGVEEQELLLDTFDHLRQTENVEETIHMEKIIYQGELPKSTKKYEKSFRLRMWVDEQSEANWIDNQNYYKDQIFTVLVNVYADGAVVINEEASIN